MRRTFVHSLKASMRSMRAAVLPFLMGCRPTAPPELLGSPEIQQPQELPARTVSLPDWYLAWDPLGSFGAHEQVPPNRFTMPPKQLTAGQFPGAAFAKVVAYDRGVDSAPDIFDARCSVLQQDGTLCPQLRYPGVVLSAGQSERVFTLARNAKGWRQDAGGATLSRPVMLCGATPIAAFVFYDPLSRPIGYVTLGDGCHEWEVVPAPVGGFVGFAAVLAEEQGELQSLCDELHLACATNRPHPPFQRWQRSAQHLLPTLLRHTPIVPESAALSSLLPIERKRLCIWARRGASVAAAARFGYWISSSPSLHPESGEDGVEVTPLETCLEQFDGCETPVGEALDEVRAVYKGLARGKIVYPSRCTFGVRRTVAEQAH